MKKYAPLLALSLACCAPETREVEVVSKSWERSVTTEVLAFKRPQVKESQLPEHAVDKRCQDGWCSYRDEVWKYVNHITYWGSSDVEAPDKDDRPSWEIFKQGPPEWPEAEPAPQPVSCVLRQEEGCTRLTEQREVYFIELTSDHDRMTCETNDEEVWSKFKVKKSYKAPSNIKDCTDLKEL